MLSSGNHKKKKASKYCVKYPLFTVSPMQDFILKGEN